MGIKEGRFQVYKTVPSPAELPATESNPGSVQRSDFCSRQLGWMR